MTIRFLRASLVAAVVLALPSNGLAAAARLRGVILDYRIDGDQLPADVPTTIPTIVRLSLGGTPRTGTPSSETLKHLDDVLALYQKRGLRVMLALGSVPDADSDVEPWREFVRRLVDRSRGKVAAYQAGEVRDAPLPDPTRYAYLLKLIAVQIRSVDVDALVLQGTVPATAHEWQGSVLAAGAAPYIDGIAISGPTRDDDEAYRAAVQRMADLVDGQRPSAVVAVGPLHLPSAPAAATARLVDALLQALGTNIQATAFEGGAGALRAAMTAATRLIDLVAGDLVPLDEQSRDLRILRAGSDATAAIPHRLVYSAAGNESYLVYWASPADGALDVEATIANASTPMIRDPLTGASKAPARVDRAPDGNRLRLALQPADHPLIVDFNFGNASSYAATVDVREDALPRVEEIIFRYQQVQAAQDAALHSYIAHVRIEQHFHPSPADPAYNLITENRLFSDRGAVEWEEVSFEFNGAKWTTNRPAFPLVQPEKVLSLPLDLRLNQDYKYRLDGVDDVGGRRAFIVRFEPVDQTPVQARALYRGTVWIDRTTFVRLRVQAVETRLAGPIVSNDETQEFEASGEVAGRPVWLLNRLRSKQIFIIAGRSVLIEREVHLTNYDLNPAEFERERSLARASNRIMYRDTDQGVRYLVKQGETRVVSDKMTSSARAFALGTDIDPSFDYPLPIGGVNILDFNFLNRNLQLALLYGGVIAAGNVQHANLWGGKFDVSTDFFGLALKSNDDVFDEAGKRSAERVNRIPVALGFNLGYQATPFHRVAGHYEFKYDAYFRDATTGAAFVVPSSTATNGVGGGYEFRRGGYSLLANAAAYRRSTWTAWGPDGAVEPAGRTFTKFDLGLSKDFVFDTFHTIHFNGTYFGGQRLDRFSAYQFGLFDATRMHGVPSAVRFAELGMFRGSYSFNLFDQYRLDLFLDHARGRDPRADSRWLPVTGTGIRVNFRAPRSTILQLDFGKSVLPSAYRGAGSTVLQILLLKPL
jgi:hypothetical protein